MPAVEMFMYYDHSTDDDCTSISKAANSDIIVETIGVVAAETKRKVLVVSDVFMTREYEGAPMKIVKCRTDEIIKSTIISRHKVGEVDLGCEL